MAMKLTMKRILGLEEKGIITATARDDFARIMSMCTFETAKDEMVKKWAEEYLPKNMENDENSHRT